MTRNLEDAFNLPPVSRDTEHDDVGHHEERDLDAHEQIAQINQALSISDKINGALAEVRGMEAHDREMDDIAAQAMDSYQQLMDLGMNVQDMAAGTVFNNAAQMLKIALEAKDSKTARKLKQIDLMLKKATLDLRERKERRAEENNEDANEITASVLDRNELLKILNSKEW